MMSQMILESRQQNAFRAMKMNCEDFRKLPDATLKRPAGIKITSMIWFKVTGRSSNGAISWVPNVAVDSEGPADSHSCFQAAANHASLEMSSEVKLSISCAALL
ncbi:hypothetical protein AAFF_G00355330 [Aldrovandia affinis]|uniref:Uncharacterized protein n=1 Tax=Aldrovandia affinis TaxID=143900 RepID=A0AAD7WN92_9TELE|nr:hypothetical protein AAFF_G00355330 [Aldrovandia affinis]